MTSPDNQVMLIVDENGGVHTGDVGGGPVTLEAVVTNMASNALMAVGSTAHKAVLSGDGRLYVIGEGSCLGIGVSRSVVWTPVPQELFNNRPVLQVASGTAHTAIIDNDGRLYTAGSGGGGRLGHGTEENVYEFACVEALAEVRVGFVTVGRCSSAAIDEHGRLYTWGWNKSGQLGTGDTDSRMLPTLITGPVRSNAVLASVTFHMAVIYTDGEVCTCGKNTQGQLGSGDFTERSSLVRVLCDAAISAACGSKNTVLLSAGGSIAFCGEYADGWKHNMFRTAEGIPKAVSVHAGLCMFNGFTSVKGDLYSWDKRGPSFPPTRRPLGQGLRVGLYNPLPDEYEIAFAMLGHSRLGEDSSFGGMPSDLMRRVLCVCVSRPDGEFGANEGIARLLGGGGPTGWYGV